MLLSASADCEAINLGNEKKVALAARYGRAGGMSDLVALDEVVQLARKRFGDIDILVNNTGRPVTRGSLTVWLARNRSEKSSLR
jgi:NAD(P)-dependent dehydrogenase (short-subunit alcohol dehydrogenase family)